ncbi:MAG TPA: hypothetical protein VGR03_17430 [Candidatus Acidoferrum sp.]|nr:hypothetical protein [Candidatus Acidoferrum sp.]
MRKILFVIAALLLGGIAAWAGDPWKQKAPKEWNDDDLRQILYNSPWAKEVDIVEQDAGRMAVVGGLSGHMGGSVPMPTAATSALRFIVRWASAQTTRRALVYAATRSGSMNAEDAEKSLEVPIEDYVVAVLGPGLSALQKFDEAALMKMAYLKPKKANEKLAPTKVVFEREADGKTVYAILFHFSKKLGNGDPTIAAGEKGMEFVCKTPGANIQTKFEMEKMVAQQGTDY